ncbi:acetyltransferase [Pedobacter antarcticus]|uniref:acetyltransferase n=1 Tax=Pedobacter antarcticus TaxID=34086 RepID=UPI00088DB976|nr:acetyltransferase [Pedobacter antarcticus]SDM17100.1 UDP-perosamine 4-acetyltransferase [Pedobacter antarcticus]
MHIIGAGGHAKVIIDLLERSEILIEGIWDEDLEKTSLMGYPINGNFSKFIESIPQKNAVLAIGNNRVRQQLSLHLTGNTPVISHPQAAVANSVMVGVGTVIMANATINSCTVIGNYAIINTMASVDHDCIIGDFVHISPQAGIAGNVFVGEGTHVGIGAVVIQGIKIGKWAIIGAGAVIINDLPDFAVVVGNPGKIIKYNQP